MNNETSNITPYEIRLNLLQIAERVVTANVGYDVENAKSMGSNHFPKIKTEDILDTATRLKEFVDGSKPKKQYPKPPPDEPTSPWVVVDTHTIKSTGSTGPIVKAQPSTNPFGPEDATNFLSRLGHRFARRVAGFWIDGVDYGLCNRAYFRLSSQSCGVYRALGGRTFSCE